MYTVMDRTVSRRVGETTLSIVQIIADTAEDVPEPDESWDAGSMCMIAEDHSFKILNNEREWV